jgi:hypothetical protein
MISLTSSPSKKLDSCSAFIIEIERESLIAEDWSRFKDGNSYVIDSIEYQDAKMIKSIY